MRATNRANYASLEQMMVQAATMVRPPERLTVSEAAEKYRFVNNPGSYVGPWDNDFAPYLVEVMDALTSLDYQGVIFAGPVRSGKSDIFFNWLTHTAICDPADMMLIHMTQNTARDWSQGDLRKVIRDNPKDLGKTVMPGRQNQNTHDLRFLNGMRLLVKWPTITELSGKTMPRLWLMDYDRMPQDIDKEGNPYDLASRRAVSFRRYGMTVAESSPGFSVKDPKSWVPRSPHEAPPCQGILSLYNRGDRRRQYWPCPHCERAFEPDFDLLRWPDSEDVKECMEGVYMECPHCIDDFGKTDQGRIFSAQKNELNKTGRWVKDGMIWIPAKDKFEGEPPETSIASFWLKGPAAAFASWANLVGSYVRAHREYENTGSQEALKTTVNTDQGKPYTPISMASERVPEDLKNNALPLGVKVVPKGVRYITTTVDVQKNCFVVQTHGHLPHGDKAVIDRYEIRKSDRYDEDEERYWVNPGAYPEDWKLLTDEVILKSYPLDDDSGRRMSVKGVACDSGGREGVTKNAYDYWRSLRDDEAYQNLHRRFRLVKGSERKGAPRVQLSYPDSSRKDRRAGARGEVPVLIINTDLIKDSVDQKLNRKDPAGGMFIFADWLDDKFYKELTAETKGGKGWANPHGRRNEAWDLICYDEALGLDPMIKAENINWDDPPSWAREWDENSLVFSGETNTLLEPAAEIDLADLAQNLA